MMAETTLAISEVRSWTNAVFEAMERAGVTSVPIDRQYYWVVHYSDAFEFGDPPVTAVSDVFDDIGDLHGEVANFRANKGMVLSHALGHLSGILTFLATANSGTVVFLDDTDEAP
jgi:hypothetical protein